MRKMKKRSILLDNPLLRVNEYSYDGPIGPMTNRDIDSTVCGIWPCLWRPVVFFAPVAKAGSCPPSYGNRLLSLP